MRHHTIGHRTIGALLDERADEHPDDTFLVFESADGIVTSHTFDEVRNRVLRCARGFADVGVGADDCVVVQMRNSPELLVTFFALAHLGAVFVPSNTANTAGELRHVFATSAARFAVAEPAYLDVVRSAAGPGTTLVAARGPAPEGTIPFASLAQASGPAPERQEDESRTVELIFTSGTTSLPKAVMLTHANCVRSGLDAVNVLWLDVGERCLTALPLFHVNAQAMSLFAALTVGGTLILLEEFRASKYWDQVRAHRATQTALVAMQLRVLLAQPEDALDGDHSLRRTFYAINVSDEEKDAFERRFRVSLINGYGCSEAMTLIAASPVVGPRKWPSVGLPAPGRVVRILDDDGQAAAPGEVGEVVVRGDTGVTIMAGYYRDPVATAAAIRDGWLHTGDKAYADAEGFLYFFDRKKDMIKRAGENVSATEVENVLGAHPDVAEVAVVGVPDPIRDQAVAAVVVLVTGATTRPDQLAEYCAARLARFKVPTVFEFRSQLPKTSVGKLKKNDLRDELAQRQAAAR